MMDGYRFVDVLHAAAILLRLTKMPERPFRTYIIPRKT